MWSTLFRFLLFPSLYPGLVLSQSYGTKFITVFPENVAYYDPVPSTRKLFITSTQNDTQVNVNVGNGGIQFSQVLPEWYVWELVLPIQAELQISEALSQSTTCISSSRPITVFSASFRRNSTEVSVVYPVTNLDKEYFLTSPPNRNSNESFRFVVMNTEEPNKVDVLRQNGTKTLNLQSYESAQFTSDPEFLTQVEAEKPVAVLFEHRCLEVLNCGCSMVFEQLPPLSQCGNEYVLPPLPNSSRLVDLLIVGKSKDELDILSDPDTHLQFDTPRSVTLLGPGFIMSLIPVEKWSYCYLLHTFNDFFNFALLVVETSETGGPRIKLVCDDLNAYPSTTPSITWTAVNKTSYSQGIIELGSSNTHCVLWHLTSMMAVYSFGTPLNSNRSYGSAALSLPRHPGYLLLVRDEKNWTAALQYCQNFSGSLGSITNLDVELQLITLLKQSDNLDRAWIGLRKSMRTGQWYWLNRAPLGNTYWADREPKNDTEAWCAEASLQDDEISWSSEICCYSRPFFCYI